MRFWTPLLLYALLFTLLALIPKALGEPPLITKEEAMLQAVLISLGAIYEKVGNR